MELVKTVKEGAFRMDILIRKDGYYEVHLGGTNNPNNPNLNPVFKTLNEAETFVSRQIELAWAS